MKCIRMCLILTLASIILANVAAADANPNFLESYAMIGFDQAVEPIESGLVFKVTEDPPKPSGEPAEPAKPSDVDPVKPSGDTPAEKPSTFDNLVGSFMKLTNKWSQIVDAFKTTRSSEIKERILGKGFEYFSQSAQIQISKGIKGEYFPTFIKHLETRVKVPEERQDDLKMVLEESMFTDSNVWTAFNTLFSVDNGGNTKFCSILVARNDETDKYDFVFTDMKADFKLAPDILVVSKKLSVLGGIWQDSKDEQVRVPKNITAEDIQTVMQFFQIVAFKGFAEQFGIKLEFPKF
jgi:hypothetical protein